MDMKIGKQDILYVLLTCIIAIFFVFDTFLSPGRLATMDGDVHATNISQYYLATRDGEFPVVWTDGFANYGMPIGLIAQPLPNYIGAFFNFFVHNPEIAYNDLGAFAVLFSGVCFYAFLRLYFEPEIAFLGVFLLTFSPFRILDFYIRGDLPEILSSAFLPIILIAIYKFVTQKRMGWLLLLSSCICLLALTHPMTLIIYSFFYIPYFFFNLYVQVKKMTFAHMFKKDTIFLILAFFAALLFGVGLASFYLLPLSVEIRYFVEGSYRNFLTDAFLSWSNFFDFRWYYFTHGEIYTRGHSISIGIIEIIAICIGLTVLVKDLYLVSKRRAKITIFDLSVFLALVILFFTTQYSQIFYTHISVLDKILFPWRMLAVFIFFPPIIICYFLQKIHAKYLLLFLLVLVGLLRFPQIYGKNYTQHPQSIYIKNPTNLYSVVLNTVWMGKSDEYPIEQKKAVIIGGQGKIVSENVHDSWRTYIVEAKTPIQLVDYTFYFPGWHVYVDGKATPIEFQDPNYRGVITYRIPQGHHVITIIFEDTTIRKLGKIISGIFLVVFFAIVVLRKKLPKPLFV